MARSIEEQQDFEAARTVYAFCLAAETHDLSTLAELRSVERSNQEWAAIAEQAISALVSATRPQVKGMGVTPAQYFKSSIRALMSLEALGGSPGDLASP